jgi:hypothetical protein
LQKKNLFCVSKKMGNDRSFVEAEDLPFRLIEIPIGSAPPAPSPPIRTSHTHHKRHAPPLPPLRVQGYDAPPSLLPPPIPKRFDQPLPRVRQGSHLPQLNSNKNIQQNSSKKVNHHRKKSSKPKSTCCVIS